MLDLEKTPAAVPYGTDTYNLGPFRQLLLQLHNPQDELRFVHFAGTKGKGSTAAMVEAILFGLGYNTCMYSSPHLTHYGERYRFNGVPWTIDEYETALHRLQDRGGPRCSVPPPDFRTMFEVLTALALIEFVDHRQRTATGTGTPHVVCWETGLGGRLDCTNVVDPVVSVLTSIGFDHMALLGNTLEQIAAEKCGIIKPGRPVVISRQTDEHSEPVLRIAHRVAESCGARIIHAWDFTPVRKLRDDPSGQLVELTLPNGRLEVHLLPLRGDFQLANFEAAATAAWITIEALGVPRADANVLRGVSKVHWPGRVEIVRLKGRKVLVLDGAHCPLSSAAVGVSLQGLSMTTLADCPAHWTLLWSMQRDKDHRGFLESLKASPFGIAFQKVYTYPTGGERGSDSFDLARTAAACGFDSLACPTLPDAVRHSIQDGRPVVALGTLSTLSAIRSLWGSVF